MLKNKISFNRPAVLFPLVLLLLFFSSLVFSQKSQKEKKNNQNTTFTTFSEVKKAIYKNLLDRRTFYCSCPFDKNNQVDWKACGFKPRKDPKRAMRVEMEHVVPAAKLCGKTEEWKNGSPLCVSSKGKKYKGRKCASKVNPVCRSAYNDMYNLRPAIGEVNNDRKDYAFGELTGYPSEYGACNFVIVSQFVDPPDNIQGDIARIYLHMNETYPELHILDLNEIEFFKKWSQNDPVSEDECRYNYHIARIQNTHNYFVENVCKKDFPDIYPND